MKKIIIISLAFLLLSFSNPDNKDKNVFIGNWTGSEKDQQIQGVTKHWQQTRFKDGSYIFLYTVLKDCQVEHFVEKGTWYIKDGLFHEKTNSKNAEEDIYEYEILDNDHIKFRAKKMSAEMNTEQYEFIDARLEE